MSIEVLAVAGYCWELRFSCRVGKSISALVHHCFFPHCIKFPQLWVALRTSVLYWTCI